MKKCLTAGLAVLLLLGEGLTGNAWEKTKDSREELVVGVSFKTLQEERWNRELDAMREVCQSQGIKLIYRTSENECWCAPMNPRTERRMRTLPEAIRSFRSGSRLRRPRRKRDFPGKWHMYMAIQSAVQACIHSGTVCRKA